MEVLSFNTKETEELAKSIAHQLHPGSILALSGDLGSGKTTFTTYLVKALGFDSRVQSPTFVIHRRYTNHSGLIKVINHYDLYRLKSEHEVKEVGLSETLLEEDAITIIEWPEYAANFLPKNTIQIKFEISHDTETSTEVRKINVQNLN